MSKKKEIYQDITENCNVILDLLKDYTAEDETPEGRMIFQCNWLKEQIDANSLPLPVEDFVQTLNYITTEKLLAHLASSDDNYYKEVEIYLYRLCYLVENELLNKPLFYSVTISLINNLIDVLNNTSRKLSQYEHGLIIELDTLKKILSDKELQLPLISYLPDYNNFNEVNMYKVSIEDLPNGKYLCKTVANLIFEGVRPDAWLTPEDAEQDIKNIERT